jgi:mannose/cellobiose epimerase-like protein (N-acyl-D-glucosamine 2-epimerase family)
VTGFDSLAKSMTLTGTVLSADADAARFTIRCRAGAQIGIEVTRETVFGTMANLDELDRDRIPRPVGFNSTDPRQLVKTFVRLGRLLVVEGIYQRQEEAARFTARFVHISQDESGRFLFESTHWWITQISRIADRWLDDLFGSKQSFIIDDLALYRTNLNITGAPTDDDIQECATLSRLIYGLSSAYLLTGKSRYLSAATAAVDYQRSLFRNLTHDGRYCIWAFGMRRTLEGQNIYEYSLNPDDLNTIPLYEQIYDIAGLAQYYRITLDSAVFDDIRRTIAAFDAFYQDSTWAGYFSHLDYATMRPDEPILGDNRSRKNWNSIGDHIPAYLLNVLLSFDPLPDRASAEDRAFLERCRNMLFRLTNLIIDKFPDPDPDVLFVNERFLQDWTPDHDWKWQLDRGIVGHNYKIAWNLCRISNYCRWVTAREPPDGTRWLELSVRCLDMARAIARKIEAVGYDKVAGGIFDAMERNPPQPYRQDFAWQSTKDFWQQEQAILAYLLLYGTTRDEYYLEMARESATFWNLFFLDHDNRGIFFRVIDSGLPYIQGNYGNKAAHAIAGYHMCELNFLAHIYERSYVSRRSGEDDTFSLYFGPSPASACSWLNVLPDCFAPEAIEILAVYVDGEMTTEFDAKNFQIPLTAENLGSVIRVEFKRLRGN